MATAAMQAGMVVEIQEMLLDDDCPEGNDDSAHGNSARCGSDSPPAETASKTPGFMERVQARVRPDADYREEIVRSIFGEVGTPVEDFSCAVVSRILLHGRMYVTNTFVCFYSNLFGFEKIIKIPFCHMRCITKEKTALFIPNAIAIITAKKEYIFRSFWDREEAFRTLKACQEESLALSASLGEGALPRERSPLSSKNREHESEQSRSLRAKRSSSGSRGSDKDFKDADDKGFKSRPTTKRRLPWSGMNERRRSSLVATGAGTEEHGRSMSGASSNTSSSLSVGGAADTVEQIGDLNLSNLEVQLPLGHDVSAEEEAAGSARSGRREGRAGGSVAIGRVGGRESGGGSRVVSDESEVDVLGVEGSPVTAVNLGSTTGGGSPPSKAEEFRLALSSLGDGWLADSEKQPDTPRLHGAAVKISAELSCQLQTFFELFISNDAEKGIPAFHETLGDSDIQATPWKVAGGALGMTREIRFVHPMSAPIGPSSTRAVKLQRCRLYGEHGLIIETSTHLEDIPMSDYFQIDDRCVVQPGRDGDSGVCVDVEVEIKFFKSTMFRKTIEAKSLQETREVWESFIGMAKGAIQLRQPAIPIRPSSGGAESDDEGRARVTRERIRERRKHRHRSRNHPHDQAQGGPAPPALLAAPKDGSSRPRAKSAAPAMPSRQPPPKHAAERAQPRSRGNSVGSRSAGGSERKAAGSTSTSASVRLTPIPSLSRWLFSFAAIPWLVLAVVFLWEGLQFLRFSGEVSGFLEAAETALAVLGEGGSGGEGGAVLAPDLALKKELARGLVRIYARNRFVWPFSKL